MHAQDEMNAMGTSPCRLGALAVCKLAWRAGQTHVHNYENERPTQAEQAFRMLNEGAQARLMPRRMFRTEMGTAHRPRAGHLRILGGK